MHAFEGLILKYNSKIQFWKMNTISPLIAAAAGDNPEDNYSFRLLDKHDRNYSQYQSNHGQSRADNRQDFRIIRGLQKVHIDTL